MRVVSRFEADLLQILHGLMQQAPRAHVLPLILRVTPRPPCLSRDAVELIQSSLARGCVSWLIRAGSWRRERYLRDGAASPPLPLWRRGNPSDLGLTFSKHSLEMLIWLTACDPTESAPPRVPKGRLTLGDRLLWLIAHQTMRHSEVAVWCRHAPLAHDGLAALAFADELAEHQVHNQLDFQPWMCPTGQALLEAWQDPLVWNWLDMERAKEKITSVDRMLALGSAQQRVLNAFQEAIDRAGRRDLARFQLRVLQRLLIERDSAEQWYRQLQFHHLRLADRSTVFQAALTMLRQTGKLEAWSQQAQQTRFYDDEYAASQLWKSDWEQYDAGRCCAAARQLVRQTEPLSN